MLVCTSPLTYLTACKIYSDSDILPFTIKHASENLKHTYFTYFIF